MTNGALAIWREAAGEDGQMPPASAIDPVRLRRILPNVVLVDVLYRPGESAPADFRYAVIGEASNEAHGVNFAGRLVSELSEFGMAYLKTVSGLYTYVCKVAEPVAVAGTLKMIGKDYRRFEAVYLPFTRTGARVDRLLAVVVYF